jgi:hypothetical protein
VRVSRAVVVAGASAAAAYLGVTTGALTLDVKLGRRLRPLGPIDRVIDAPPEVVFDVIAFPYLTKTPHAMDAKLRVVERGADMVLAEHFTPIGLGLKARTLETVRFERPSLVSFRLVRGPVPHVTETFELTPATRGTTLRYSGELGADLWALGRWWARIVATRWEHAVERSLDDIAQEAERRHGIR